MNLIFLLCKLVSAGGGYKNKIIMRIYGFQIVLLVGEVFLLTKSIYKTNNWIHSLLKYLFGTKFFIVGRTCQVHRDVRVP